MTKTIKNSLLLNVIALVMLLFLAGAPVFSAQEDMQEKIVDFLFVQHAKNVVFDNGTLTLEGVSPTTGAFYDYNSTKNVYVVVNAPAGAGASLLPSGYATVPLDGATYYYAQGVFYSYNPGPRDYVVVDPPQGAIVPSIPEGYQTVNLNGVGYYDFNGVYYQPVQQGDTTVYQVAGGK